MIHFKYKRHVLSGRQIFSFCKNATIVCIFICISFVSNYIELTITKEIAPEETTAEETIEEFDEGKASKNNLVMDTFREEITNKKIVHEINDRVSSDMNKLTDIRNEETAFNKMVQENFEVKVGKNGGKLRLKGSGNVNKKTAVNKKIKKRKKLKVMNKSLKENALELSPTQRAKFVQERCQTFLKENDIYLDKSTQQRFDNVAFISSQRYSLSICSHNRVVSTNIKRFLYALDYSYRGNINYIRTPEVLAYSRKRITPFEKILRTSYQLSIMFVREPLERLLSAYRDQKSLSKQSKDPSLGFKTFLQDVLDTNFENMDKHIYPYFERCRPCEMKYNFIGLQRSFTDDMKTVLQKLRVNRMTSIPEREEVGSERLMERYFKNVPDDLIHKLWKKYYKDYYIFGFPYPSHLMNKK